MDYINWANADPAIAEAENYFSYRRLRMVADGTGYGVFDFRLQMTLEPGSGNMEHNSVATSPLLTSSHRPVALAAGLGKPKPVGQH